MANDNIITGWHVTSDVLRNKKPLPKIGEWYTVDCPVKMCKSGLHACQDIVNILYFGPNNPYKTYARLHCVELKGNIQYSANKIVAQSRRIIYTVDFLKVRDSFSQYCFQYVRDMLGHDSVLKMNNFDFDWNLTQTIEINTLLGMAPNNHYAIYQTMNTMLSLYALYNNKETALHEVKNLWRNKLLEIIKNEPRLLDV